MSGKRDEAISKSKKMKLCNDVHSKAGAVYGRKQKSRKMPHSKRESEDSQNNPRLREGKQTVKNGECTAAGFSLAHRKEVRKSVKYMVIFRHREKYSVSEMCRFFAISRSGYYDYVGRMGTPAKDLTLAKKTESVKNIAITHTDIAECIYGWLDKEYTVIPRQCFALCKNTACHQRQRGRNAGITQMVFTNILTTWREAFMQIASIING